MFEQLKATISALQGILLYLEAMIVVLNSHFMWDRMGVIGTSIWIFRSIPSWIELAKRILRIANANRVSSLCIVVVLVSTGLYCYTTPLLRNIVIKVYAFYGEYTLAGYWAIATNFSF